MTPTTRLTMGLVLTLLAAVSVSAGARADVVGSWSLAYTTTDGVKLESTLSVKMDGGNLSGAISSSRGSVALNEISVTGDDVAFAIIRVGFGDTIRIEYTGKVDGDTMRLTMKVRARQPHDVTAKRTGAATGP